VGKPKGKGPHGRPRLRWEKNIKKTFKKWDGGLWTGLIWVRIRTGGDGGIEHSGFIHCGEFLV
jgi:hypothetical protein